MSWRRIIFLTFVWISLVGYLVISLGFVTHRNRGVICSRIEVKVIDSIENSFISAKDIKRMIDRKGKSPIGKSLWTINTYEIESNLTNLMAVRDVQAYKTVDGALSIMVKQRQPVVRIFNKYNQSYYIDDEAKILPLSDRFAAHVLVVNGNITEPFRIRPNIDISIWQDSLIDGSRPLICEIYDFANYLAGDDFWNAQIAQVYVDGPNDIELIPRVGSHLILLGSFENYALKLNKLKKFYEEALPAEGWNKYKLINLKYSNQIICKKR